jgi:RimJ/RimL family protein N-acetyltransferase
MMKLEPRPERRTDVTLRPLTSTDTPAMYGWMLDPTVSKNLALTRSPSIEYTRSFIERSARQRDLRAFAILLADEHVGNVVLDRIDLDAGSARMSIYLGEHSARNQGVGRAALFEILDFGFDELCLDEIWLTVLSQNQPALRIYEMAGFKMAPERECEIASDDLPEGTVLMMRARSHFFSPAKISEGAP